LLMPFFIGTVGLNPCFWVLKLFKYVPNRARKSGAPFKMRRKAYLWLLIWDWERVLCVRLKSIDKVTHVTLTGKTAGWVQPILLTHFLLCMLAWSVDLVEASIHHTFAAEPDRVPFAWFIAADTWHTRCRIRL
jgi:hypothetical protein